tara:strand:+ start:1337 stop:1609 length:273 start_codon:yes stop_codon:yes gene_type:complete
MVARERVDMIQISRKLRHASMRITEEHYAHYHPDYMGQKSDHSSPMLQNFLERQLVPKVRLKYLHIEFIYFFGYDDGCPDLHLHRNPSKF